MKQTFDNAIQELNKSGRSKLDHDMLGIFVNNKPAQLIGFTENDSQCLSVGSVCEPASELDGSVYAFLDKFLGNEFAGVPGEHANANTAIGIVQSSPDPFGVIVYKVHLFTHSRS